MPYCREATLKLVGNCTSAASAWNLGKAMNSCASDMFNLSALFTKCATKSKTRISSLPFIVCLFSERVMFYKWIPTSVVAFDDLMSVLIISRFDLYEIILSKCLSAGLIYRKPSFIGPIGRERNVNMFIIEESGSSYQVTLLLSWYSYFKDESNS